MTEGFSCHSHSPLAPTAHLFLCSNLWASLVYKLLTPQIPYGTVRSHGGPAPHGGLECNPFLHHMVDPNHKNWLVLHTSVSSWCTHMRLFPGCTCAAAPIFRVSTHRVTQLFQVCGQEKDEQSHTCVCTPISKPAAQFFFRVCGTAGQLRIIVTPILGGRDWDKKCNDYEVKYGVFHC